MKMLKKFLLIIIPLNFLSCIGMPVFYPVYESVYIPQNYSGKEPKISLIGVSIDRFGGWSSIEREIIALTPGYFWKKGCRIVSADENPEYAAWIQIREREINHNSFKTKKSLLVEILIWDYKDAPEADTPIRNRTSPIVVGRVIDSGEKTFYSSAYTGRLLSKAIAKAADKLKKHNGRPQND